MRLGRIQAADLGAIECLVRVPLGCCCAGQGVVAFARGVHNGLDYALKLFVERSSFLAERDMYRSQTLGRLLPQVRFRRGLC